jgi:hypothetical protein
MLRDPIIFQAQLKLIDALSEAGALQQKRDESMTERVVRGVNHCRTALLAGYTTYR